MVVVVIKVVVVVIKVVAVMEVMAVCKHPSFLPNLRGFPSFLSFLPS